LQRKYDKERKALAESNEQLNLTNEENTQLAQAIKTLETDIALLQKKLEEAETLIGKLTKVCFLFLA
jgi:chromosome segregation ATPase